MVPHSIGAQTHTRKAALSPVMYGGELEVCPNSNAEAPGKTSIAPAVLATAYSNTGALREATATLNLVFSKEM